MVGGLHFGFLLASLSCLVVAEEVEVETVSIEGYRGAGAGVEI